MLGSITFDYFWSHLIMNIIIKFTFLFLISSSFFVPTCSSAAKKKQKANAAKQTAEDEILEMLEEIEFDEDLPEDTGV